MREGVEGERTKREEVYDWMIRRGYNGLVGRGRKRPRLRGDGTECVADVEFGVLTRASSNREERDLHLQQIIRRIECQTQPRTTSTKQRRKRGR